MKLVTKAIETAIKNTPYGSTEAVAIEDKKVIAKFFNPYGVGTWFVLEDSMYESNRIVFGAVDLGMGVELGDFSIAELEATKIPVSLAGINAIMRIERDRSVDPGKYTLGQLMQLGGLKLMY